MSRRKSSVVRLVQPQFGSDWKSKLAQADEPKPESTTITQPTPESVRIEQLKKLSQQMRDESERNPPTESKGKYDIRRAS